MDKTGLYFLQPYDPDRIPLVFVHGLFSTPFDWVQTINGLQADPEIRKHYQFWVFAYPTGNPILYSALRLREELARADKLYPNHRPYVVVGHSMGGMLTHMQVITVTQAMWEKALGETAKSIFSQNSSDSLIVRATTFQANPRIKRVVFICTPHRGSKMASSGLGKLGISLIALPVNLATAMTGRAYQRRTCAIDRKFQTSPEQYHGPETVKSSVAGSQCSARSPFRITRSSVIAARDRLHQTALMVSSLTGALISMARNPK